jgi:hypothetical protein
MMSIARAILANGDFFAASDERHFVGTLAENIGQPCAERFPVRWVLVDQQTPLVLHLHHNRLEIGWLNVVIVARKAWGTKAGQFGLATCV